MKMTVRRIILLLILICPIVSQAAEVFYYSTDNVGTPVAMWDKNGKKVWEGEYYPFGEEYRVSETTKKNDKRFTGKEKDKETGLTYFGARYMDEGSGRFIQPDPVQPVDPFTSKTNRKMLENPQRLNRYAYGLNNPYRYIDPDGEWAEAVFIEGPSIAVGVSSFVSNVKNGNIGSAVVDAGGIIVDSAAAIVPGVPGGVGLGIKLSKGTTKLSKVKKSKTIEKIGDGKFTKTTEVRPGKGPGSSRAEYVRIKNSEGRVIRTYKDSFDRANNFQGRKPLRGGPEGRPQKKRKKQ